MGALGLRGTHQALNLWLVEQYAKLSFCSDFFCYLSISSCSHEKR